LLKKFVFVKKVTTKAIPIGLEKDYKEALI